MSNILILFRLLVQMEETDKVFDNFWDQFSGRLKQCHALRAFEESFNIVQVCYKCYDIEKKFLLSNIIFFEKLQCFMILFLLIFLLFILRVP